MKGDIMTKFNKKRMELIDFLVSGMLNRVKFTDMVMNKGSSSYEPQLKEINASQAYLLELRKQNGIPMPIFEKIYSKKLIL
jgi:hypothetical protein